MKTKFNFTAITMLRFLMGRSNGFLSVKGIVRRFPSVILLCGMLIGPALVPQAAHADELKRNIYVLGVHLGGARSVLFGVDQLFDPSKQAHPTLTPLIRRQLRWSIDLARLIGTPTAAMERLERELDSLTFVQMRDRLPPICEEQQFFLARRFNTQASGIFVLAIHQYDAAGVALRARDFPLSENRAA